MANLPLHQLPPTQVAVSPPTSNARIVGLRIPTQWNPFRICRHFWPPQIILLTRIGTVTQGSTHHLTSNLANLNVRADEYHDPDQNPCW
uniref:Uncharacterized protein n=1 Tax=Fagus sylvatica TaxID=28930 RepID=A0A2N9I165_FAGSY